MSYQGAVLDAQPPSLFLTPASPQFSTSMALSVTQPGAPGATAWHSTNDPCAVEFRLDDPITVYQLGWLNGSTLTDNFDVGIYDSSWNRWVSTGSTARSGASVLQFVDIADTVIPAGKHYLVGSAPGTTGSNIQAWAGFTNATMWGMFGLYDSATDAFPLPNPLTSMAAATVATRVPHMVMALRSLV